MASGSRREDGGRPTADGDGTAAAGRSDPSLAECPHVPAGDGDTASADRLREERDDSEDDRVQWHRSGAGDQVVLAVETGGVRVAVAFPADAAHEDVRPALDERDRELRHFFRTGRGDR